MDDRIPHQKTMFFLPVPLLEELKRYCFWAEDKKKSHVARDAIRMYLEGVKMVEYGGKEIPEIPKRAKLRIQD